ncbi:8-oxoguanine DNA glycosylase [Pseudoloma neurophilia]|uniref:8-oxoguanine DNA glycosylase n=1 Tax=Pseudoloma neurophilia TaxID=146866 RepID=A0A0R0M4G1_9MICR|nr:8-oxoguanine DNA glycosylase [Pseudoloma neurophilia]
MSNKFLGVGFCPYKMDMTSLSNNEQPDWHLLTCNASLNLSLTFNSGQVFHFVETTSEEDRKNIFSEWTGVISRNCYTFQQRKDGNVYFYVHQSRDSSEGKASSSLTLLSIDEHISLLKSYFSLDDDYKEILKNWVNKIVIKTDYTDHMKRLILEELANSSYFCLKPYEKENLDNYNHKSIEYLKNTLLNNLDDFSGLRLLNADLCQTIFSFLCSQNNFIGRIKQNVRLLYSLGEMITKYKIYDFHTFPELKILADEKNYEIFKSLGYRDKYVIETAKTLSKIIANPEVAVQYLSGNQPTAGKRRRVIKESEADELSAHQKYIKSTKYEPNTLLLSFATINDILLVKLLTKSSYTELLEFYKRMPGISDKVADCILLYACNFKHVVPFDAHMIRVGKSLFSNETKKTNNLNKTELNKLRALFFDIFGEFAGLAQLFMFDRSVQKSKNTRKQPKNEQFNVK